MRPNPNLNPNPNPDPDPDPNQVLPVIKVLDKAGIAGNSSDLHEGDQVLSVNGHATPNSNPNPSPNPDPDPSPNTDPEQVSREKKQRRKQQKEKGATGNEVLPMIASPWGWG